MAKSNLNQFENGEHIFNGKPCFRIDNSICNEHDLFISDSVLVDKYCGACVRSSVCKGYLNNYNSSFNTKK